MILEAPRNSTTYKITGTETFRLSSSAILDEYGGNLQNVEKSMRRIYVADTGYKFVQVDQSGAEALVVAYVAPKGQLRDLFTFGVKPHTYVALHVFADKWRQHFPSKDVVDQSLAASISELTSVPGWKDLDKMIKKSDDWEPSKRYYFLGKKIVHASNYGMMASTFSLSVLEETEGLIAIPIKEATQYLAVYHKLFPEIGLWHLRVQRTLKESRVLHNLFGYPRKFTGYIGESMFKEAFAFVPQSTVGTITNIAVTNTQNYVEDNNLNWHLLANTHDSFMTMCPDNDVEECARVMKRFIEIELTGTDGTKFRMKSEAQAGNNWAPKKDSNPSGLVEVKV